MTFNFLFFSLYFHSGLMTCVLENSCIKIPNNFLKTTFLNKNTNRSRTILTFEKIFSDET